MMSGTLSSKRHREKEESKHLPRLSAEWAFTDKYYKCTTAAEYQIIRGSHVVPPILVIQRSRMRWRKLKN